MNSESNASIYLLEWARGYPGRRAVFDGEKVTLVNLRAGAKYEARFETLGAAVQAIENFRIGWVRA